MTPHTRQPDSLGTRAFIAKRHSNAPTEEAGAQAPFEDLCARLSMEPPRIEDEYQYERGLIKKSSARQGWADVWKRGCFAWEYKAPDKNFGAVRMGCGGIEPVRPSSTPGSPTARRYNSRWCAWKITMKRCSMARQFPKYTWT